MSSIDLNQPEVVERLRNAGCTVQLLNNVGHGTPDILVGWFGRNYLFEIKRDGGKLRDSQHKFLSKWRGQVAVIRTAEEAIRIMRTDIDYD